MFRLILLVFQLTRAKAKILKEMHSPYFHWLFFFNFIIELQLQYSVVTGLFVSQ